MHQEPKVKNKKIMTLSVHAVLASLAILALAACYHHPASTSSGSSSCGAGETCLASFNAGNYSYTVPSGFKSITILAWGGGGGGGLGCLTNTTGYGGGGGGGGGFSKVTVSSGSFSAGDQFSVTVGSGGLTYGSNMLPSPGYSSQVVDVTKSNKLLVSAAGGSAGSSTICYPGGITPSGTSPGGSGSTDSGGTGSAGSTTTGGNGGAGGGNGGNGGAGGSTTGSQGAVPGGGGGGSGPVIPEAGGGYGGNGMVIIETP